MSRSRNSKPRRRTHHVCEWCAPKAKERELHRKHRRSDQQGDNGNHCSCLMCRLSRRKDDAFARAKVPSIEAPECLHTAEIEEDDPCWTCGAYDGWCEDWCVSYRDEPEPLRAPLIDIVARVR